MGIPWQGQQLEEVNAVSRCRTSQDAEHLRAFLEVCVAGKMSSTDCPGGPMKSCSNDMHISSTLAMSAGRHMESSTAKTTYSRHMQEINPGLQFLKILWLWPYHLSSMSE